MSKKKKISVFILTLAVIASSLLMGVHYLKMHPDFNKVYSMEYQDAAWQEIEDKKAANSYTPDSMLIEYNPFMTNTQSLYVYFETEKPATITYTVHVDRDDIQDFTKTISTQTDTKEHEFSVLGLIPNTKNTITFDIVYKDGTAETKETTYKMGSLYGHEDLILEQTVSSKSPAIEDGFYVVLGNDSTQQDFTYYYDTNGVLRSELPITGYRNHRNVFKGDLMYFSAGTEMIVAMNALGRIERIYDLGQYELHHDYVFDQNGNLLILATNLEADTVEDYIICLDLESGEITNVLDMGTLFASYKESTSDNKGDDWDWLHLNTIQYVEDKDSVIVSSRETSTIIKLISIHGTPSIEYMMGPQALWADTEFAQYLYTSVGDFSNTGGQHSITIEDQDLSDGQYHLYMFNNNYGRSTTNPDFDWSSIEGLSLEVDPTYHSLFYEYAVDENTKIYSLVNSFEIPFSAFVSSAQKVDDKIVTDTGMQGLLGVYDMDGNLLQQFHIPVDDEGFIYRIYHYDFEGFYF